MTVPVAPAAPAGSFREAPSALNREAADMPSSSAYSPVITNEGPSDIVVRPSGLRHGRWEAPQWAFWTTGSLVIVAALVYALYRLGYFRRKI